MASGGGLAGGKGRSWGWVRTKTEGEATTLLESQETWVLLCFVVVVWILPKVQLYITVSEFRFCMRWWWGVAAGEARPLKRIVLI